MKVQDVMTRDVAWCTPDTSLYNVARMMVDNDCGAIPVMKSEKNRQPVGIVTDRDIACRSVARGNQRDGDAAGDVMSYPVFTVHPETELEDCCRIMEHNRIRRVVVVDNSATLCGMVTLADLALGAPNVLTAEVVRAVSRRPRTATRFPMRA